jgi:hypothetical protein
MTLAFFMLTVDRRQQLNNYETRPHPQNPDRTNYITNTLNRLYESGCFESRTTWTLDIIDSGSGDFYAIESGIKDFVDNSYGRAVYHNKGWNAGANKNFLVGLQTSVARGADYVVLIEDDIDVIDGFVDAVADWLTDHQRMDAHVYVFGAACLPGTPKDLDARKKMDGTMWETSQQDGEWTYPPGKFMGTQCIALRTIEAQQLAFWLENDKQFNKRKYGYDVDMRRWVEATYGPSSPFVCTAPSFVQHVGNDSAIHLGRFHIYASFPGHEWRYQKKS